MASITLLGSNSGRNAGDAAILASIMGSLSDAIDEDVTFEVPTTNPAFVRQEYGKQFKLRAISVMPWTGSIRLLGIPTARSIRRTDLTLITDGIIFDIKLFNPLFNFLITLVFLVPWARFCGKPVVCYNVGIGPLTSFWGRLFAKWVGSMCDLIMVRDQDSKTLFEEIGVTNKIHLTADAVFTDWGATDNRLEEILRETSLDEQLAEGDILGVNVTRYVDTWLRKAEKVESRQSFLPLLADVLSTLKHENRITPVIFITQIMDVEFGERLQALVRDNYYELSGKQWAPVLVSNRNYDNHELLSLASKCKLFIGMRLHSVIIAARAGAPVVGLVYAPKVRSFLTQLRTPELAIELKELTAESLAHDLMSAWKEAAAIRETQQDVAKELSRRAEGAAAMLGERYYPAKSKTVSPAAAVANN